MKVLVVGAPGVGKRWLVESLEKRSGARGAAPISSNKRPNDVEFVSIGARAIGKRLRVRSPIHATHEHHTPRISSDVDSLHS